MAALDAQARALAAAPPERNARPFAAMTGASATQSVGIAPLSRAEVLRRAVDDPDGALATLPAEAWFARPLTPGSEPAEVMLRGAVLVRARGRAAEPPDLASLPPDLAAALTEPPPRPARRLLEAARGAGRVALAPLAIGTAVLAAGVVAETALLRGSLDALDVRRTLLVVAAIALALGDRRNARSPRRARHRAPAGDRAAPRARRHAAAAARSLPALATAVGHGRARARAARAADAAAARDPAARRDARDGVRRGRVVRPRSSGRAVRRARHDRRARRRARRPAAAARTRAARARACVGNRPDDARRGARGPPDPRARRAARAQRRARRSPARLDRRRPRGRPRPHRGDARPDRLRDRSRDPARRGRVWTTSTARPSGCCSSCGR